MNVEFELCLPSTRFELCQIRQVTATSLHARAIDVHIGYVWIRALLVLRVQPLLTRTGALVRTIRVPTRPLTPDHIVGALVDV